MIVAIVDYGSGNLRSAAKAFERAVGEAGLDAEVRVTAEPTCVLRADRIVGVYEDGWDLLRAQGAQMPRTVNYITGPSRSGDIAQTMQLGAHGPLRLHIVLAEV